MSNVKGRFGVEVQFNDSTTIGGAKSLKSISLQHSTEYDFGKIAIVTGTVGTTLISLAIAPTAYKNASGEVVSFTSVSRFAFSASGPNPVRCTAGGGEAVVVSRANQIAVSEDQGVADFGIEVLSPSGTASFTLVMYGA
jgi:hypothetical protein